MLRHPLAVSLLVSGFLLAGSAQADDLRAYINAPQPLPAAARAAAAQEAEQIAPVNLAVAAQAHDQEPLLLSGTVVRITGRHRFVLADMTGRTLTVRTKDSTALLNVKDSVIASGHLRKHLFGRVLEADDVQRTATSKLAASY